MITGKDGREALDGLAALLLLLVFAAVVPRLGDRTAPVEEAFDCSRVPRDDMASLERCVALHPGDVELMADLGAAFARSSQPDRAVDWYRRALTIDPEDGDLRVRLADLLLLKGDVEGARREGTAALAVQPGGAPALDVIRRIASAEASR